jgi:hypothetical protein
MVCELVSVLAANVACRESIAAHAAKQVTCQDRWTLVGLARMPLHATCRLVAGILAGCTK